MRKFIIIAMLALTACQIPPKLAEKPKDLAKYEAISEECHSQAFNRSVTANENNRDFAAFGALGGLLDEVKGNATLDKKDDFHKTVAEMWHECVAKHGYKLAD